MTNQLQLGFDHLLASADEENLRRRFEAETEHLPATMESALPYYGELIERHHLAMLRAEVDEVMGLREQARKLALKLNGGKAGILADEEAPGCVLERETAAPRGEVPLFGQKGEFIILIGDMKVRIELDGIFGIGSSVSYWPGFSAYAVDFDQPFLSETGYRSFLGIALEPTPGMHPEDFVTEVVENYQKRHAKSSRSKART